LGDESIGSLLPVRLNEATGEEQTNPLPQRVFQPSVFVPFFSPSGAPTFQHRHGFPPRSEGKVAFAFRPMPFSFRRKATPQKFGITRLFGKAFRLVAPSAGFLVP
jgi:hypothetical protein